MFQMIELYGRTQTQIVVGRGELVVRKVGGLQAVLSQDVLAVMGGSLAGLCTLQSDPAGQAPNADGGPGEEGC